MVEASPKLQRYFKSLLAQLDNAIKVAEKARAQGFDPKPTVEVKMAEDMAGRVEGLVGPEGIADKIREYVKQGLSRERVAYEIVKELASEGKGLSTEDMEKVIDQALRTGVAVLTEGVLVAPTEGIAKVKIKQNPDGSHYLAVYYAGPIRSAGGTAAALSVVLADVIRRELNISNFRPTETVIERYVEEIQLYDARCARLQYNPTEDEIRTIVKNCPICITGEPTHQIEVSVYKNLEGIETDRVRGGMALVIGEGIAQKAAKVLKLTRKIGLDWEWLESIVKVPSSSGDEKVTLKPNKKFLSEVLAGRPIISYPMAKGGFRLRYGRSRVTGIMAKGMHPATMVLLDGFIAIGTQMKVERPGKGCIITPCTSIHGPIVKLKDGSVMKVTSTEMAIKVKDEVKEILFLGDLATPIGDFIKSGHPLVPGAWCEEWWTQECKEKGVDPSTLPVDLNAQKNAELHVRTSREKGIPLHPEYTFHWHDVTPEDLIMLAKWLTRRDYDGEGNLILPYTDEDEHAKRVLEELCVPHSVFTRENERLTVINKNYGYALIASLGMDITKDGSLIDKMNEIKDSVVGEDNPALKMVNKLSNMPIKAKAPVYVGARMGRPEKAKDRKMNPPVHVLFPLGHTSRTRDIVKTYQTLKRRSSTEGRGIKVEIARNRCPRCGNVTPYNICEKCGSKTVPEWVCPRCGRRSRGMPESGKMVCSCGAEMVRYDERTINLVQLFDAAKNNLQVKVPDSIKGVKGMISGSKMPERLEKGILRAKHNITVFRDGTSRFDATDAPITHFKPKEIGVSIEKLKELGYETDYKGNPITDEDQIIELYPQDIIIPYSAADFLVRVANFIDDMLVYLYGIEPFYNIKKTEDLLGHLVITQSPHTSAGILSRIVGFTKAYVCYAHPYLICGRRRNCDGDEDSIALLLDSLINFSHEYLPKTRGGTMDTPILLTTVLDPAEVDDEVHVMDVVDQLPLEFYRGAEEFKTVDIKLVKDLLGKPCQYEGLGFVFDTDDINEGVLRTTYVAQKSMKDKINAQFRLQEKVRAVDIRDAAERLVISHFLPDLYGNMRAFSRQSVRCVDCNTKYRRPPLSGRCYKCGGKLTLTVHQGGIEKYLDLSFEIVDRYKLPEYLRQRLLLLRRDLKSMFDDELKAQLDLTQFM